MSHSHCPLGCDHPQPITADGNPKSPPGAIAGHQYCGRCWVQDGHLSEMVPCTTELCADFIDFATVRVYSPEEHGVLDAQFIPVAGGVGVQVDDPNPWVFVCREHFSYEPEQKTVGIAGSRPCAACGRTLVQGPGTVTIRRSSVAPRVTCTPITKEQADEAFAALRAMPELSLGPGPHTAVEDENGAVHLLDKDDVIRASMPKDVYEEILEHNPEKAPVT